LPQGPPVGRTTRPATSRDRGWILPSRYDKHRRHHSDERIPLRRRRALAVSLGCRANRAKGSQHRRIHRCKTQSDDSARNRSGTGPHRVQDLQWLLVFRPPDARRSASGPARRSPEVPTGLGYHTPEMKTAWKEGRKDLFYPYGKAYAQTIGEQD